MTPSPLSLSTNAGHVIELRTERWHGTCTETERRVLSRACSPTLDIGCGPGRLVRYLEAIGVPSLGIDVAPSAVRITTANGGFAIHQSVFDRLPWTGLWRTALLFDGNIGIGGDPVALLTRVNEIMREDGNLLVELEPPGITWQLFTARLDHHGAGETWFPWARVGTDGICDLAAEAGWDVRDRWCSSGRWFAELAVSGR